MPAHDPPMAPDPSAEEWNRWRGSVTTSLTTLTESVSGIAAWVDQQKVERAAEDGARKQRQAGLRFLAPNLYQLLLAIGVLVAIVLEMTHMAEAAQIVAAAAH